MKRVAFLVGQWEGGGWIEMGPGTRTTWKGTEVAEMRLNGLLLLFEGHATSKPEGSDREVPVHDAFAVFSFDEATKKYVVRAFLGDGKMVDTNATVSDSKLQWGFSNPGMGNVRVRFTITSESADAWSEIGEYSMDGQTWRQNFEAHYTRKKAGS